MPNWCANRLRVSGPEYHVKNALTLIEGGEGVPLYARAAAEGIQIFLAGCAGLLRPVEATDYAPYPALVKVTGNDTPQNRAFTQWVAHLRDGAELTPEICNKLHELWLASGLQRMTWSSLSAEQQTVIAGLWQIKHGDWYWMRGNNGLSESWDCQCREDALPLQALPFDMLQLIPPRLDAEINGYNGRLLHGVPDGFSDVVERFGIKWPHAHNLDVSHSGLVTFDADFDTPWSPPSPDVLSALSERYGVTVEHWYAESGSSYCGWAVYEAGCQTGECCDSLEWGDEEDEFGFSEVTGPAWIIDNVASYGG